MKANGHGQRILFVDDEKLICLVARRLLVQLGYEVAAETDAHKAFASFQEKPHDFSLLVTDLTMPGMSGLDLCVKVREIRRDLPVVLITGFDASLTPERLQALGVSQLLSKPFTAEMLEQAVRQALVKS